MIRNWKEYKEYLKQDLMSTGIYNRSILYRFKDSRIRFYKSLRFTEFIINSFPNWMKIIKRFFLAKHTHLCNKLGWIIPPNVFDKGLSIIHVGTIVVSNKAKIGKNCRIHVCVNIGNAISHGESGAPIIGDNVYIGPGAKIFGPIVIGNYTAIGANAVVNKSFQNGKCTLAGVPAKIISNNTSEPYITSGTFL